MLDDETRQREVYKAARGILDHLAANPLARDTAIGIARWWVGQPVQFVVEALELLTQEGVVAEVSSRFGLSDKAATADMSNVYHVRTRFSDPPDDENK